MSASDTIPARNVPKKRIPARDILKRLILDASHPPRFPSFLAAAGRLRPGGRRSRARAPSTKRPINLMSAKQRAKLLAHSFAAVQFSHAIMRAFIQALLGVSLQHSSLGVLGDVLAYHFNDEEQGRGSLHYHGLVWLKHKPDTLHAATRDVFTGEIGTIRFARGANHHISGFILDAGRIQNFQFTRKTN